jgi:iron complex outermembrane receptor protein
MINNSLQAEYGWNYETGFRIRNSDESMFLDASVFYYHLQNAIVPRFNPNETQYYVNSGGTSQPGFELYFMDWILPQNNSRFIRGLQFNESVTLDKFTFSGTSNQLTGVPEQVLVSSLQLKLPQSLYLFVEHNYTSRVPLNDANTTFASQYNLLRAKAGWQYALNRKNRLDIYAGADNLLNEKYSLGNDLNAVGNRYYNPAPPRNYYVGFNVNL